MREPPRPLLRELEPDPELPPLGLEPEPLLRELEPELELPPLGLEPEPLLRELGPDPELPPLELDLELLLREAALVPLLRELDLAPEVPLLDRELLPPDLDPEVLPPDLDPEVLPLDLDLELLPLDLDVELRLDFEPELPPDPEPELLCLSSLSAKIKLLGFVCRGSRLTDGEPLHQPLLLMLALLGGEAAVLEVQLQLEQIPTNEGGVVQLAVGLIGHLLNHPGHTPDGGQREEYKLRE